MTPGSNTPQSYGDGASLIVFCLVLVIGFISGVPWL